MLSNKSNSFLVYLCSTIFGVAWLTYFMFRNEAPVDSGDGLMHYYIAQGTWKVHSLFLDHWGKPMFSLLASPFAQFGLNGVIVFNILVYLGSCLVAQKLFTKLKTPVALQAIFPLVLLLANDYSMTLLAGLTEPLFNLWLLICALFLVNKKWLYFALAVSLLPFFRSEGQLPVILAGLILVGYKQYKFIPFLVTGFVVYAIIGYFLIDDFWWYINDSPYHMDNGIYGHGTWDHYLLSYRNYIGNVGLYILMLGIPAAIYFLIKRKWENLQFDLAFFAYGIFLGVVVLHSYFWATGQNASFGLTRIATQGMPLFILVHLGFIGRIEWFSSKWAKIMFASIALILCYSLIRTNRFPQKENIVELQLNKAKTFVLEHDKDGRFIYFSNPYLNYLLDVNPFTNDERKGIYYMTKTFEEDVSNRFNPGDYFIWDSHFGPMEQGITIERINQLPELVLVNEFVSGHDRVQVYQRIPLNQQKSISKESPKTIANEKIQIASDQEYTDVLKEVKLLKGNFELGFTFKSSSNAMRLVFDNGNINEYFSGNVNENDSLQGVFQFNEGADYKMYIWNPDKVKGTVYFTKITASQIVFPDPI